MKEADKQAIVEGAKRKLSRKGFLLGGAGVLGSSVLLGAMPGMASAQQAPPDDRDINLLILNYALTLEHLEATFYAEGLRRFGGSFDKPTLKRLQRIRKHEDTHVRFLQSAIEDAYETRNSDVPRLQYNFGRTAFTSRAKFLQTASLLENTGVSAYDGAIAHITVPGYLTAGATIATVEARHATYVDSLIGKLPFPLPFDRAVAPRTVARTVRDTFVSSDPTDGPYGPYDNYNQFLSLLPSVVTPAAPQSGSNDAPSASRIAELQEQAAE